MPRRINLFSLRNHFENIPGNAGFTDFKNSVPKWSDYGADVVYRAMARRRWFCDVYTTAGVEQVSLSGSNKSGCVRQCFRTTVEIFFLSTRSYVYENIYYL